MKITATDDQSKAVTITLDGNSGRITAGGQGKAASLVILDAAGTAQVSIYSDTVPSPTPPPSGNGESGIVKSVGTQVSGGNVPKIPLATSTMLSVRGSIGATSDTGQAAVVINNDGTLTLMDSKGNARLTLDGGDGTMIFKNAAGANTVSLNSKGASGWFGGAGVDGDVLVFAAGAKGTDASQAAVWIKGSTGDVVLQNAIVSQNADCAEDFDVQANAGVEPGAVLTLSDDGTLIPSSEAYDRKVAGVVSGAGGLRPGIVLGRTSPTHNRWPIALSGKVFCKVDANESPVAVGDLLTTSATLGHAMAARDQTRAFGAVIGKALAPLASGCGLLPVLVALQ
jgi:hypothetical protein